MWHVSSFGIISGLIGRKKYQFSNLFYLWIQSVFYSIIFFIKFCEFKTPLFKEMMIENVIIIINKKYWYITSYFGIYPFFPFINTGLSNLSKIDIKKSLYYIISVLIIWASFSNDCFGQLNGKSPFSLLIYYLIGCYMGKYIFIRSKNKFNRLLIYIMCFLIYLMVSFISYKINVMDPYKKINIKFKTLLRVRINSFPMLMQIFCLVVFIAQIKFSNFISNVTTFIAPLIFDVYLIHENPYIRSRYIKNSFKEINNNIKLVYLFILIIYKSLLFLYIAQ